MKLLPDSIRSRTVVTLVVGLTASHLASTAISPFGAGSMGGGALSSGSIASTFVMAAAIVVFSWWASGWITAPLSAFARAAERLGLDVNAPPLVEDGPEEVRVAAHAFNQMQTRIRSFVDDRLRMLAAIAHDLRGPITRVRLRVEQMAIDDATQRKIIADLDEMAQMVESSLAFARDEATTESSQPVDLATFDRIPSQKAALILLALKFGFRDDSVSIVTERLGAKPFHGRTVLLVDQSTTGAGERIAAFAQERKLAPVVGGQTAGRLICCSVYKISHGYYVRIPARAWYTWRGELLEGKGVQPDCSVPDGQPASGDVQLDRAVDVVLGL